VGVLNLNYPIEKGIVNKWDDLVKILRHTLINELKVDPAKHNIFLSDQLFCTKKKQKRNCQNHV
jgi:actin-related protein